MSSKLQYDPQYAQLLRDMVRAAFDVRVCLKELDTSMSTALTEATVQLQLDGRYNPYLRISALPPLHVGLHCALDTTSIFDYSELVARLQYDPHPSREGRYVNRAHSMRLKSMTSVPFHPNIHPSPTESAGVKKPWWQPFVGP